jgi:16S rRNA processing protein RimM
MSRASRRGPQAPGASTPAKPRAAARAGKKVAPPPMPPRKPRPAASAEPAPAAKPKHDAAASKSKHDGGAKSKPEGGAARSKHEGGAAPRPRPVLRGDWIPVAEIARPHGIQGELRLKVFNPDSDLLAQRPKVRLRTPDGVERDVAITTARDSNKALLVRIAGVDDRNAAEALRGAELCVPREDFPPLPEGEFYACDVEGARALLPTGEEIGLVYGLNSYPTCDVLLVERSAPASGRIEVPLLPAYVDRVDVKAGVVHLLTIEGLD